MTNRAPRNPKSATAAFVVVALLATIAPVATAPVSAATPPVVSIVVDGRGNGHGIGMSQWGAYGWATQHGKSWREILSFYYGSTTIGDVRDSDFSGTAVGRMTVQLTALDGSQTAVVSDTSALTTPADTEARSWSSLVAREVSGQHNVYAVWGSASQSCPSNSNPLADTDGWTLITPSVAGPINFATPNADSPSAAVPGDLVGVCEGSGAVRYYRGTMRAANTTTSLDRTVNDVLLESYVRGVVPRESSASWADAAGGAGMNSLKAQAVAARSYSLAGSARSTIYKTCDTTSCQVYSGAAVRTGGLGTSARLLEDSRTNAAVDGTAGVVVRTSADKVANTMFASSNGGRTVSGGMYPAVDDAGDAVAANPHHTWSLTLSASQVMSAWSSIGNLLDIEVTQRSGGGPWGGWVDKIVLKGSSRNVTISGDDFRRAFGLKSRYLNFTLVRATSATRPGPALFIGDAVGVSVKTDLRRLLAAGYDVTYATKSSRCTTPRTGTCNTNNALPIIANAAPPAFVLMQLGYNDIGSKFGTAIDTAMRAITSRGVTRVVWVNLSERRLNKNGVSVFASSNAALRAAKDRWPQLIVLDWNAASSGSEATTWFVKGTKTKPNFAQLTSLGRTRFALFLRSQLDDLSSQSLLPTATPPPPTTTTTTTTTTTAGGSSTTTTSTTTTSTTQPAPRPTLTKGDSGPFVVELQNALRSFGATVAADGEFGTNTDLAVKAFQTSRSLLADGIVGTRTWTALGF